VLGAFGERERPPHPGFVVGGHGHRVIPTRWWPAACR
jgi:hypothetical protein